MSFVIWLDADVIRAEDGVALPLSGQRVDNLWNFAGENEQKPKGGRLDYLKSFGYIFDLNDTRRANGNTLVKFELIHQSLRGSNRILPVEWVVGDDDPLCPSNGIFGEVKGWQSALRLSASAYDSVVPDGIKGADGALIWRNWRASNQDHYHDSVNDIYYIPTSAYDAVPLVGTQCRIAQDTAGINVVARYQLNDLINDGDVTPVA